MSETTDIGVAIGSGSVSHRDLRHLKVLLDRAKDQIKITERVKLPKKGPILSKDLVVLSADHLGPAEGVSKSLVQQPGEQFPKKLIPQQIQESHGLFFHRIDQARAVDILAFTLAISIEEFYQIFRWGR